MKRSGVSGYDTARFNQASQSTARIPVAAVQPQRDVDHNPVFITRHEQPGDVTCTVTWSRWFSERFAQPTNPNTRPGDGARDRKSTRLNSSHQIISYAVFSLKKKNTHQSAPQ